MLSLRDVFFWPSTPNIFHNSWQVTFPHSLITLTAFSLDFHQILCSLFGLCCPNLCLEVWLSSHQRHEEQKSLHTTPRLYFVLHLQHPWSRKALNSKTNISSASFTTTLKLTRTFNIVNSTKLEEVTLKWLSSLSLHPKMTEHFRVTPGNTQTQACTHSPRTINRDLI